MYGHANFSDLPRLSDNSLCCLPNRVTAQQSETQCGVTIRIRYGDVRQMRRMCAETATWEVNNILSSFIRDSVFLSQAWRSKRLFWGGTDYKPHHGHVHFNKFRCSSPSNHKFYRHEICQTCSWRLSGSTEFFLGRFTFKRLPNGLLDLKNWTGSR